MNNRSLDVYAGKQLMGQLQDSNGFWSFKYDQDWLNSANKFAITPSIPLQDQIILDSGTTRPVQQFFDNLLPEENARELLAKEVKVDHEDSFALLTASGIESAGALTLLPEHVDFPSPSAIPLPFAELSRRIKNLPRAPLNIRQSSRMSLAGAQHKMLVIKLGDELFEGNEGTPSTHILKPDHSEPDQYWQTTCNEWFMMKLAKRLGIDVPNVQLIYTPEPAYLVERFDRAGSYPDQERKHIIDSCQLLSYSRHSKYSASTVETYQKILNNVRPKAATAIKLYQWVIYNLLVGNGDAHLKNISFYYENGSAQITPFYDLLSTIIYVSEGGNPLEEALSVPINDKKRFCDVTKADVIAFAKELGIPNSAAVKQLSYFVNNIESEFRNLYQELVNMPSADVRAAELRMLRQVQFLVVKEMIGRLS